MRKITTITKAVGKLGEKLVTDKCDSCNKDFKRWELDKSYRSIYIGGLIKLCSKCIKNIERL